MAKALFLYPPGHPFCREKTSQLAFDPAEKSVISPEKMGEPPD
jgi:hypothetical protein